MDYENICKLVQKIDSKIRFAGVINSKGRLVAGGMAPSKTRLGDRKRDEMLYMELALRVKMRSEFDDDLGKVKFSMSFREKLIVMSFPIENDVLMVSMESKIQFEKIAFSISKKFIGNEIKEDDLRKVVQVNAQRGVDFIKTRGTERAGLPQTDPRKQTYTELQLKIIVDEANKYNIPVMAHAHGDEGGYAAVKAGVKSIEHGTYLTSRTLKLMKKMDTFLVPTFTTVVDLTQPGGDYDNPVLIIRGQHMLPSLERTIKMAYKMGIKIATGADTGYGPNSTTRIGMEITNFINLGMKPIDAIRSATIIGAELLGISKQTGTIDIGKDADIIVVTKNPLNDARTIQDVVFVMSNGNIALNRLPFGKD